MRFDLEPSTLNAMWWRAPSLPSPEEWQAFASVMTLLVAIAAGAVAAVQLTHGRRQLELSAVANARAAEAAESEARPYVSVTLEFQMQPSANPKKVHGGGVALIVVQSVGRTPARSIELTVSPPFESSGKGRPPGEKDPALEALATIFSGQPIIGMLAPAQRLEYVLDFTDELVGSETLPQRYDVTAKYSDGTKWFSESHILDVTPWAFSIAKPAAIDVIARQMRRINENLDLM